MPTRRKNRNQTVPTAAGRPRLAWRSNQILVPSPGQARDPEWRFPLLTLEEPGHLGPVARQGWSVFLAGPSHLTAGSFDLTAHGFCIEDARMGSGSAWIAAAGVLVFDLPASFTVELRSADHPVTGDEQARDLEVAECSITLLQHLRHDRRRAVLAVRALALETLRELAASYLDEPVLERWGESQGLYASFWAGQDTHDAVAAETLALAVEDLAASLRGASGVFPYRWVHGRSEDGEGQLTSGLYDQVRAWSVLQPAVAQDLVKCALCAQAEDGAVPRIARPDGYHDFRWAPLPMLARCAWVAWQSEPNREFHDFVLPRLQRYLQWSISHYDPEWRGLPRWHEVQEAWTPETFRPDVASADLPALLAWELDAFSELARAVPAGPAFPESMYAYRASLGRTLSGFFWNKEAGLFMDRFPTGEHVKRLTLAAALPLLDTTLPRDGLQPVAERLDRGGSLRAPTGVREWERWPDEAEHPPVREDHQLLLLDALAGAGMVEVAGRLSDDLRTRDGVASALRLVLLGQPAREERPYALISPLLTWMNEHRLLVLGAALAAMLLVLGGLIASLTFKRSLTVQAAETSLGLAQRYYRENRLEEARDMYHEIAASGRIFPGLYFDLGNAEFKLGHHSEAESAYRLELVQNPNNVMASMNLALTLLHQQRTTEAQQVYAQVTNRFAQADPVVAERAALALRLLAENPPRFEAAVRPVVDQQPATP